MAKMKTKQAVKKRVINISPNGKYKCAHAYRSHLATSKTTKQKRHLRKPQSLSKTNKKNLKYALHCDA